MSKYIQTFVVDRTKWKNSHTFLGRGAALLDGRNGSMCCLGFVCEQLGVKRNDLEDKTTPYRLKKDWDIPYLLTKEGMETPLTFHAITINDEPHIPPKVKEKRLKELFNQHELDIRFVGKSPKA